jgi:hypothetical protein
VIGPDENLLHEWAEFNLPAEFAQRRGAVLSPLARRVLTTPSVPADREAPSGGSTPRAFPRLGSLLLPGLGFRSLPKP